MKFINCTSQNRTMSQAPFNPNYTPGVYGQPAPFANASHNHSSSVVGQPDPFARGSRNSAAGGGSRSQFNSPSFVGPSERSSSSSSSSKTLWVGPDSNDSIMEANLRSSLSPASQASTETVMTKGALYDKVYNEGIRSYGLENGVNVPANASENDRLVDAVQIVLCCVSLSHVMEQWKELPVAERTSQSGAELISSWVSLITSYITLLVTQYGRRDAEALQSALASTARGRVIVDRYDPKMDSGLALLGSVTGLSRSMMFQDKLLRPQDNPLATAWVNALAKMGADSAHMRNQASEKERAEQQQKEEAANELERQRNKEIQEAQAENARLKQEAEDLRFAQAQRDAELAENAKKQAAADAAKLAAEENDQDANQPTVGVAENESDIPILQLIDRPGGPSSGKAEKGGKKKAEKNISANEVGTMERLIQKVKNRGPLKKTGGVGSVFTTMQSWMAKKRRFNQFAVCCLVWMREVLEQRTSNPDLTDISKFGNTLVSSVTQWLAQEGQPDGDGTTDLNRFVNLWVEASVILGHALEEKELTETLYILRMARLESVNSSSYELNLFGVLFSTLFVALFDINDA